MSRIKVPRILTVCMGAEGPFAMILSLNGVQVLTAGSSKRLLMCLTPLLPIHEAEASAVRPPMLSRTPKVIPDVLIFTANIFRSYYNTTASLMIDVSTVQGSFRPTYISNLNLCIRTVQRNVPNLPLLLDFYCRIEQ
jgi:hypothetical protein